MFMLTGCRKLKNIGSCTQDLEMSICSSSQNIFNNIDYHRGGGRADKDDHADCNQVI